MPQFCSDLEAVGLNSQEVFDFQRVTGVIFAEIEVLKYDSQSLAVSAGGIRYRQHPDIGGRSTTYKFCFLPAESHAQADT